MSSTQLNIQPAESGEYVSANGEVKNIATLLGQLGAVPVQYDPEKAMDILNRTTPKSGLIVGRDGTVYDIVNLMLPIQTSLQPGDVIDNTNSTETQKPLSANMGRILQLEVNVLKSLGKFLSLWDATAGLPVTNPDENPYTYKTGDFYIVSNVGETNYRPTGTTYDRTPSTTEETVALKVLDFYVFDGSVWVLLHHGDIAVSFGMISGEVSDNAKLVAAFAAKQNKLEAGKNIEFVDARVGDGTISNATLSANNKVLTTTGTSVAGLTIDPLTNINNKDCSTFKFHVKCKVLGYSTVPTYIRTVMGAFGSNTYIAYNTKGKILNTITANSPNISTEGTYYFEIEKDSTGTITERYSSDNTNWTVIGSKSGVSTSSVSGIWVLGNVSTGYLEIGTEFYLDDCYVVINGQEVWRGYSEAKAGMERVKTVDNILLNNSNKSIVIGGSSNSPTVTGQVGIGIGSAVSGAGSTAVGAAASSGVNSTAVGASARVTAQKAIIIGYNGANSESSTFKVAIPTGSAAATTEETGLYTLLTAAGKIPAIRLTDVLEVVTEVPTTPVENKLYFVKEST